MPGLPERQRDLFAPADPRLSAAAELHTLLRDLAEHLTGEPDLENVARAARLGLALSHRAGFDEGLLTVQLRNLLQDTRAAGRLDTGYYAAQLRAAAERLG